MKPVYVYSVPTGPPEAAAYQYLTIVLVQGLRQLGVRVVGNLPYWHEAPGGRALIEAVPEIHPADCAAVVVSHAWPESGRALPPAVTAASRGYATVYLDLDDGAVTRAWTPPYRAFDRVLRVHSNRFQRRVPSNVHPWAFGLSERLLAACAGGARPGDRKRTLLVNFRVRHLLRRRALGALERAIAPVLPLDRRTDDFAAADASLHETHLWAATGRRHTPAYYTRLRESLACAAFGGFYGPARIAAAPRALYNAQRVIAHGAAHLADRLGAPLPVYQWDSWRLWESFAAGAAAFHVDLDAHGAALPVMPRPGVHYVALDLAHPSSTAEQIAEDPGWLPAIAEAGRAWAVEHYAPAPTARRFLDAIGLCPPSLEADARDGYAVPVEPKPPDPRDESSSLSAGASSTRA